jgi:hypothetical protein
MAVTVQNVTIWRKELKNQPGELAGTLDPLVKAGINLQVLMGYRLPGQEEKAAIELYPISGRKAMKAARDGGLVASSIPALHVSGDDKPGLMQTTATALAAAGINVSFVVAQVVGRKYTAIWGFESAEMAKKAASIIKRVK